MPASFTGRHSPLPVLGRVLDGGAYVGYIHSPASFSESFKDKAWVSGTEMDSKDCRDLAAWLNRAALWIDGQATEDPTDLLTACKRLVASAAVMEKELQQKPGKFSCPNIDEARAAIAGLDGKPFEGNFLKTNLL